MECLWLSGNKFGSAKVAAALSKSLVSMPSLRELECEVIRTIKRAKLPKPNISKGERTALNELKKDKSTITLPADKQRVTVLMNITEYREKMTAIELVDKLKGMEIPPGQKLVSYDVTALFTSVPVDKALEVITRKLHEDDNLPSCTEPSITQIVELLV
ncbi:hypothetical protein LSAT2_017306 [Lamellibrachia satsuma]|nr:hypothetical protein LSAT2_017306 [Lamellibrachia satsuma]